MSIRDFNKIMNPTCVGITMGVILIVMVASFLAIGFHNNPSQSNEQNAQNGMTIAIVGNIPLSTKEVSDRYQSYIQASQMPTSPDAVTQASIYGAILNSELDNMLSVQEAKLKGITISDSDVLKSLQDQADQSYAQAKVEMMMRGSLKANASDADVDAAFKATTGKTLTEIKAEQQAQFTKVLSTEAGKQAAEVTVAKQLVISALAKQQVPSDEQLKNAYSTYSVKRIFFNATSGPNDLTEAQSQLKSGTPFETLIDRYTKDSSNSGKKPSAITIAIVPSQLSQPPYNVLTKYKAGDVTDPIQVDNGTAIFKILSITPNLPKDFNQNKAQYQTTVAQALATQTYEADIKKLMATSVTWKSPAYENFFKFYQVSMDPTVSADVRKSTLDEVIKVTQPMATAASTEDSAIAALAFYNAVQLQYQYASAKDKDGMLDLRIAAAQSVQQVAPGAPLQLQLAQLMLQKRDFEGVIGSLQSAIDQNSDFGPSGDANLKQIKSYEADLKSLGKLTPDAEKSLNAAIASWQTSKAEFLKQQAQANAAQAAAAKEAAAQQAQQEAAQKAAEKAAKNATPTKGSGTTAVLPGTTGGNLGTTPSAPNNGAASQGGFSVGGSTAPAAGTTGTSPR